ncbi:MAG: hypothetical protein K2Y32_00390 [Candidatus Obscuribacterales bacterium]|nr:hypothetical protein [Candidatus Obscuribacterales bacterium]
MRFDDLEARLRVYEQASDRCVPPGFRMIARLDGRGFSKLTSEDSQFKKPFDVGFYLGMQTTTQYLMSACGFSIERGYHQSDEISLLFAADETAFNRKLRKLISVLAGEASATLTRFFGQIVAFDCRISELPTDDHVRDYFSWRQEDATRNCLNTYAYWLLRRDGYTPTAATKALQNASKDRKKQILAEHSVNYDYLPKWQREGSYYSWQHYEKAGWNPVLQREEKARRKRLIKE